MARAGSSPAAFRVWPLWYVAAAFYHSMLAGLLLLFDDQFGLPDDHASVGLT